MTEPNTEPEIQWARHRRPAKLRRRLGSITYGAVVIGAAAAVGAAIIIPRDRPSAPVAPVDPKQPVRYLGVYEPHAPDSYAEIDQFARRIGRQPNLVSYYSYWLEPFQAKFASAAKKHGAETLVQIDAKNISLASIASGQYDHYLRSYATAVKAFGAQVILSFGHEMNGNWYSWGYQRTSASTFVAAWRHIVTTFREEGTTNITWLWNVNIIDPAGSRIPDPTPWWPGSSYVNWVGIDGYYYSRSWTFASVFGPTITAVRELTRDPILIAETGAASSAGQTAKVADLFAGVSSFGLLGFLWFDQDGEQKIQDWRIRTPATYAEFRRAADAYMRSEP